MRWRGLDPAIQMHACAGQLPKGAWLGAVGGFLLDGLQVHIELNQDIHRLCKEIALLQSEMSLVRSLLLGDAQSQPAITAVEESLICSARNLEEQDIPEMRQQMLRMLRELLQENATGIIEEQKDLRIAVIGLLERHIEIAVNEAGYNTVPNVREVGASALAGKAGELVRDAQAVIPPPQSGRGLPAGKHATVAVDLDRAVACALLGFSQIAEKHARLSAHCTIAGRMKLLGECAEVLVPAEPAAEEPVDYRRKHDYQRAKTLVSQRLEQFARDLQRLEQDLELCIDSISKARALKLELSKVRSY